MGGWGTTEDDTDDGGFGAGKWGGGTWKWQSGGGMEIGKHGGLHMGLRDMGKQQGDNKMGLGGQQEAGRGDITHPMCGAGEGGGLGGLPES